MNYKTAQSTTSNHTHVYTFEEQPVGVFNFEATVHAHGWLVLPPFAWNDPEKSLSRIHRLASGQVVRLLMQANKAHVAVKVETTVPLTPIEVQETHHVVRRMLRLDEDLSEFYQFLNQMANWNLGLASGAGRLLRCPNLFEDIVYTLCTTNIAWSGTKRMVERLTTSLGHPFLGNGDGLAFPSPQAIAQAGPEFLKQETGLGYRSGYMWQLAVDVVEGKLNLATFEDESLPTPELHRALLRIKGVGNYAAATILMLLGRYEHLAIDSEMRAFVSQKYFDGAPVNEAQMRAVYAPWGRWQYLAYWFDLIS